MVRPCLGVREAVPPRTGLHDPAQRLLALPVSLRRACPDLASRSRADSGLAGEGRRSAVARVVPAGPAHQYRAVEAVREEVPAMADLEWSGELIEWRGPPPYYFVLAPPAEAEWLADVMPQVTYGWGMVPVHVRIGGTEFTTAMWPRHGTFWVPVKAAVRAAEQLEVGDAVTVQVTVRA